MTSQFRGVATTVIRMRTGLALMLTLPSILGAFPRPQSAGAGQAATSAAQAVTSVAPAPGTTVPPVLRFSGQVTDQMGKPRTGVVGITFALYQDQEGGAPLWMETQNVRLDEQGHYTVLLGSQGAGLPVDLFNTGKARWLGAQVILPGVVEQPRVVLVAVPYALKAGDADTLGGIPASAFLTMQALQASANPGGSSTSPAGPTLSAAASSINAAAITGGGTTNFIPLWTSNTNLGNSLLFQTGGNVGISTTTPAGKLDVNGSAFVRGTLHLPALGTATAARGFNSNAFDFLASSFNSTTSTATAQRFRWQAEPVGNNTTSPSGKLNLLFAAGAGIPAETGLSIGSTGLITFASGQTFAGAFTAGGDLSGTATSQTVIGLRGRPVSTASPSGGQVLTFNGSSWAPATPASGGSGTVTNVNTGAGLTGGPITTSGTISIPSAGVTNSMLANNSITVTAGSGLSGGGAVALGGTITLTNTAPSSGGTVTSVGSGTGLTGGPVTTSGTLALDTTFTDSRYLQLNGGTLTGGLNGTTGTFSGTLSATTGNFSSTMTAAGASLPATGIATNVAGFNSNALDATASAFNSNSSAAESEKFRWQVQPAGNNTASPSGTLNLLFGSGSNTPAQTGLSINNQGLINFASGQTFPGAGGGTITGVTAGTDLTGGGTSGNVTVNVDTSKVVTGVTAGTALTGGGTGGNVTLNVDTTMVVTAVLPGADLLGGGTGGTVTLNLDTSKVPQLATPNTFTAPQTINGNFAVTGGLVIQPNVTGTSSFTSANVIGGFSGNTVSSGKTGATIGGGGYSGNANSVTADFGTVGGGANNTASGSWATVGGGQQNTAFGAWAVVGGGAANTVTGQEATVPGGFSDVAGGSFSFAAGTLANAAHVGAFVWGDNSTLSSTHAQISSTAANQFVARAVGGFSFVAGIDGSGNPDPAKTVSIAANSGIMTFASGQTFPGSGGVSSVGATAPLSSSGGATPTISLSGVVPISNGGTGSSTQNFVDLTTSQTVGGNKTFSNTIAGSISGNAATATSAMTFSGSLAGEVTGTQGATVVSNAVSTDTASGIVRRDGSGNFTANTVTLDGNLALPNSSASVGALTMGGTPFLHNFGTANTFVGQSAGNTTMTGAGNNTAVGFNALTANTAGIDNTAFGASALMANTTGLYNAAFGQGALAANTNGTANTAVGTNALHNTGAASTAVGYQALAANNQVNFSNDAFGYFALASNTTGGGNAAFGQSALQRNTTSGNNSAFGSSALQSFTGAFGSNSAFGAGALASLVSGSFNIAIGSGAGLNLNAGESNNIYIGPNGVAGESNAIRIGFGQTKAFMDGISGATSASGIAVLVNNSGQLGTTTSSRRFKDDIAGMGAESNVLMKLRPVAFYYKPQYDATHTRQYGLVAEEVAQIAPGLVVFDKDGVPQTVRYHFVNAMLLNEVQKQRRLLAEQQRQNEDQQQLVKQQQAEIAGLRQQLQAQQKQMEAVMLRLAAVEKSVERSNTQQASLALPK